MTSRRDAFTLIELLVVTMIVAILSGMAMSMIGTAQRSAKRAATQSVLRKTDMALRSFKSDYKTYPYQAKYPDLAAGESWTNNLYYRVGTAIADADRDRVLADMNVAGAKYSYDCRPADKTMWRGYCNFASPGAVVSPHVFTAAKLRKHEGGLFGAIVAADEPDKLGTCAVLNRLAAERARLIVLSGDREVCGVTLPPISFGITGGTYSDPGSDALATLPLVPAPLESPYPTAAALDQKGPWLTPGPGWADDYLQGELEPRFIRGEQILDAYGRPLVYINQVQMGVRASETLLFRNYQFCRNPEYYGLATIGRKTLSHDAPADPAGGLPDPSDLMDSDVRTYAAPSFEIEFELWSAGPDGRFANMRSDVLNRDNIPCLPYTRGIE